MTATTLSLYANINKYCVPGTRIHSGVDQYKVPEDYFPFCSSSKGGENNGRK